MSNPRFIIPCEGNKIHRTSWCSWQTLLSQHSQVNYKREGGLLEKVSGVCDPLPKTFPRIFPALIKAEALFLTKPSTKPYPLGPHIYLLSHEGPSPPRDSWKRTFEADLGNSKQYSYFNKSWFLITLDIASRVVAIRW